jgi:hypothetical protein
MIPLFKTHFSIGKSILSIDDVERIAADDNLEEVFFVEDSMTGFPSALNTFREKLRFGLRFSVFNDDLDPQSEHKMIAFADGDDGCKELYKLHTKMFQSKIKSSDLASYNNLVFAVPFYDSFLYNNFMFFSNCIPELPKNTKFIIENNGLPFDHLIEEVVAEYCKNYSFDLFMAKSIYYEFKNDVEAFQTYKCICNRKPGTQSTLSKPNLNHFGSDEFCFESWKERSNG